MKLGVIFILAGAGVWILCGLVYLLNFLMRHHFPMIAVTAALLMVVGMVIILGGSVKNKEREKAMSNREGSDADH